MDTKNKSKKIEDVYHRSILTRKITLDVKDIGANIKEIIEKKIKKSIGDKCITEGYIKSDSIFIINYSSGKIVRGHLIEFDVVFECDICLPVEGMLIECVVKNITKAGVRAEIHTDDEYENSPLVIFIARDHHVDSLQYNELSDNDKIVVRVIGQRFQLNDNYITIIAELYDNKTKKQKGGTQPKKKLIIVK